MHPLYAAPPHLLTLIRELLPIGFPLESLVKFIEQDWKSGFTTHDIADWAAIEGITHLESTERRIHPAETNHQSENDRISNQIKPIQTQVEISPEAFQHSAIWPSASASDRGLTRLNCYFHPNSLPTMESPGEMRLLPSCQSCKWRVVSALALAGEG